MPLLLSSLVLVLIINLIVYFVRIKKTTRKEALYSTILELGICICIVIIGLITLLPTRSDERYIFDSSINLGRIFNGDIEGIINLILYIPLFFILIIRFRRVSYLMFVLISIGLSILIETMQYILPIGRIATINDVVLNVFGSFIGILMGVLLIKLKVRNENSNN